MNLTLQYVGLMRKNCKFRPAEAQALERYLVKWNQFDGNKSVFRAGAVRGAMPSHRASAATPPGSRFDPPQAGCF
jgi:hypothetical protein